MINFRDQEQRFRLISAINTENNKARKQIGLKSSEINGGRIEPYVKDRLRGELDLTSVKEMPLVTSINVQNAIVQKKATVYKKKPERKWSLIDSGSEQEETLNLIYKDMMLNQKLNTANKNYIYQDQTIGMIIPKNGKLICRIMKMHQIDVVPSLDDPETAEAYVLSAFDRTLYIQQDQDRKDRDTATGVIPRGDRSAATQDQDIEVGEKYQFQKYVEKYIVWSKDYNFMMNGLGEIIDPETGEASNEIDIESPLAEFQMMPFFEVSKDKDFEFFVRSSNNLSDFTIQLNSMLSDLANNIKMNGYAVGVLKAPSELQPQEQVIGASMLLKLPTDDPEKDVDFQFTSPSSNIGEISDAIDKILNLFITSEGVGGGVINSRGETEKAMSGIDRFLQMIQRVEAHSDDYDAFNNAEHAIFKIIKAWLTVLNDTDKLDQKYKVQVPEDSEVMVNYARPEMIETETEKLNNIEKKIDLRVMSRLQAVKEIYGIDDDDKAREVLDQIAQDESLSVPNVVLQDNNEDEDQEE